MKIIKVGDSGLCVPCGLSIANYTPTPIPISSSFFGGWGRSRGGGGLSVVANGKGMLSGWAIVSLSDANTLNQRHNFLWTAFLQETFA